jgi:hypothetical protein
MAFSAEFLMDVPPLFIEANKDLGRDKLGLSLNSGTWIRDYRQLCIISSCRILVTIRYRISDDE